MGAMGWVNYGKLGMVAWTRANSRFASSELEHKMATSTEPLFLRFSTGDRSARDPVEALRELNEQNLVFRLDALAGRSVHADILVHAHPELRILSASLCGVRHGAGPESRSEGGELLFATTVSGTSVVRQRGREVTLADGDAVLIARNDGDFTVTHADSVHFLGFRAPRADVAALLPDVDSRLMKPVPRNRPALALLSTYLQTAAEHRLLDAPEHREIVVHHLHDLLVLALGATGDAAALAAGRGVPAARLRALQADVVAHLEDPALSAAWLATRHRITARYVHKLFENAGTTLSQYVLEHRLTRAYRQLIDPRRFHDTISAVAFDVGFGDLSYFYRTFRRRYGMRPTDVRRSRAR
jgi:AraC-like DNA-binding protein